MLWDFFLEVILSTRSWVISSKKTHTLQTQIWLYSQTSISKLDSIESSSPSACYLWGVQETLIQDKEMSARFAYKGGAFSSCLFRGTFNLLIFCSPFLIFFCHITWYYLWNISINSSNNNNNAMLWYFPFYLEILKHFIQKDHYY